MPSFEIELILQVPAGSRAAVRAEMGRGVTTLERASSTELHLDTPDHRLARAGLSWRLRREGRRWVQVLQVAGAEDVERCEHVVPRPDGTLDDQAHAGTPAGKALGDALRAARADGAQVGERFRTEVRRTARRVRARGATFEVAFDQGKLMAGTAAVRLCEISFGEVVGSTSVMLTFAERWRARFGLVLEPRTTAQRGERLADGERFPPVRKAQRPTYAREASAGEALGAVLDECLAQVTHNAIGLLEADPALRVDQVHQLRIGVRRLRSALRSFAGWAPAPPDALVDGLKALFAELGRARDADVLKGGVAAALAAAGAPRLALPAQERGPDLAQAVGDAKVQRVLLGWLAWRASLGDAGEDASGAADYPRSARRRLRRWHRRIEADGKAFDDLDEAALHALRKRIKRQRYAVEFFIPVLRRRHVARYLKPLAVVQDRMGELNDLFVAKARYEALVESHSQAWFALGWITARIAEVRALVKAELRWLAEAEAP